MSLNMHVRHLGWASALPSSLLDFLAMKLLFYTITMSYSSHFPPMSHLFLFEYQLMALLMLISRGNPFRPHYPRPGTQQRHPSTGPNRPIRDAQEPVPPPHPVSTPASRASSRRCLKGISNVTRPAGYSSSSLAPQTHAAHHPKCRPHLHSHHHQIPRSDSRQPPAGPLPPGPAITLPHGCSLHPTHLLPAF